MIKEEELYEQFLSRLILIKEGCIHKSKWNQDLAIKQLDLYITDYKNKLNKIYEND